MTKGECPLRSCSTQARFGDAVDGDLEVVDDLGHRAERRIGGEGRGQGVVVAQVVAVRRCRRARRRRPSRTPTAWSRRGGGCWRTRPSPSRRSRRGRRPPRRRPRAWSRSPRPRSRARRSPVTAGTERPSPAARDATALVRARGAARPADRGAGPARPPARSMTTRTTPRPRHADRRGPARSTRTPAPARLGGPGPTARTGTARRSARHRRRRRRPAASALGRLRCRSSTDRAAPSARIPSCSPSRSAAARARACARTIPPARATISATTRKPGGHRRQRGVGLVPEHVGAEGRLEGRTAPSGAMSWATCSTDAPGSTDQQHAGRRTARPGRRRSTPKAGVRKLGSMSFSRAVDVAGGADDADDVEA